MLARTILEAKQLGISEIERDALLLVLKELERDEIPHFNSFKSWDVDDPNRAAGFNMTGIFSKHECGTAACILGWAIVLSPAPDDIFNSPRADEVDRLFGVSGPYPKRMSDVTPAEAAAAIRGFLATGKTDWADALAV